MEVLDEEVLRVCFTEAVEIDEEVVPGCFLDVAAFEGFEGEVGGAPGEGRDEVRGVGEDVEGGADVLAGVVVGEDGCGVVGGFLAGEDGARGFEKLREGEGWVSTV